MDFTARVLPDSYHYAGWALLGWLLWRAWLSGTWRALAEPGRARLFFVACAVVLALWQVRTGVKPGLAFHLYGVAALTLMFGYWRAVLAGSLILLVQAALGRGSLVALGLDVVLTVALPAWLSWQTMRLLQKHLPRNFFVYALGNGFFGAALSVVAIGIATTLAMSASGAYTLDYLLAHYTPYATLLISWAEAFSTGMAVTVMAVYRPEWLETYDEVATISGR